MGNPRTIRLAGSFLLILVLAMPSGAQTMQKLRVMTTATDSGAEIFYAQELGYFKRAGLDVEITALRNGAAVAAAVASGAADIGQGNIASLAVAHERGLPFVLLAPASLYSEKSPTTVLMVDKNSTIKTAHDLVGKTIGGQGLSDIGTIAVDAWLRQQGVDPTSVHIVEVPSPEMIESLSRGTIAAATLIEPYLSAAVAAGDRVLAPAYTSIAKSFLIGAYFSTRDWAKAHPAQARAFSQVLVQTARWANANHDRSARILEQYTKIRIAPGQARTTYALALDPPVIQPLIDAAAKDHVLKGTFPAAELLP